MVRSMMLSSIFMVGSSVASNTTARDSCTKAVTETKCIGTSPFCDAHAEECKDGWKYDRDVQGAPCGEKCWTGHKVVCSRCIPCVATAKITGSWQKMASQPGGTTLELTAGWKKGEEHTRSETWGQEVTVAAEASMTVEDIFSMKRSISATFSHSLTQTDKTYWESTESKTIHFTFDSFGIVYQWAYTIDDGCGVGTTYSASYHLTKKGPPCCIPEDFVDPDSPETSDCIQGPNLCQESHETTDSPPTDEPPEPASPEQCPAGADFQVEGTAPFCGGETSDCKEDWKFLEFVKGGQHHGVDCGKTCWTGQKALCFRCKPAPAPTPAPTTETTTMTDTVGPDTATTTTTTESTAPNTGTTMTPQPDTTATTTQSPVTPSPSSCRTCLTTCAPCRDCLDGRDATFPLGSCEKCWQCWDWDDDELEDDDDHMDKECDAMNKHHDWDDEEVRCLTDKVAVDCRACWATPQNMIV